MRPAARFPATAVVFSSTFVARCWVIQRIFHEKKPLAVEKEDSAVTARRTSPREALTHVAP
eukprot:2060231-Alexandrium_andersonii.AAC.1